MYKQNLPQKHITKKLKNYTLLSTASRGMGFGKSCDLAFGKSTKVGNDSISGWAVLFPVDALEVHFPPKFSCQGLSVNTGNLSDLQVNRRFL